MTVSPTATRRRGDGALGLVGLGAAACVACCLGPIVAFLSGIGVLGLVAAPVVGVGATLVTVAAIAGIVVLRRRRTPSCTPDPAPVPVTLGTTRAHP